MKNRWMLGGSMVLLLLLAVGQAFAAEGSAPAADPAAAAPAPAPEAPKAPVKAIDDPAIAAQLQTAPAGLKGAIAEQIKAAPETYNASAEPGYLGIPGASGFWLGLMGGLDFLHRGCLWRRYGRRGTHERAWPWQLRKVLWQNAAQQGCYRLGTRL